MDNQLESFLTADLKNIFNDGEKLLVSPVSGLADYSYIIFPFAKGFEGFLKLLFFRAGIITEFQYKSDRWRVGKALNPNMETHLRAEESSYDRLVNYCTNGKELADKLWAVWRRGRNTVFHYFPGADRKVSLAEAKEIVEEIKSVMNLSLSNCKLRDQNIN